MTGTAIRAIAFDLDDTLLDTSGLLLPAAAQRACSLMVENGLNASMEQCLQWRRELSTRMSHKRIFHEIARRAGHGENSPLGEAAMVSFYQSPIPESLPLLDGAEEVLREAGRNHLLFLVTSGSPETQKEKIRATGVGRFFRETFVVNKLLSEKKSDVFRRILDGNGLRPAELLSVGNRLSEEIRQAKEVGAWTCYFRYGEHVGEQPERPEDHPDFTILEWKDFFTACRL